MISSSPIIKLHEDRLKAGDKPRLRSKWSASLSGQCPRKRYYERLGEIGKPFSIEQLKIFEYGKCRHIYWQEEFRKLGVLVSAEEEHENEYIVGHSDAIVEIGKEKFLYDIKTVNQWKFARIKDIEDDHYIFQLMVYLYLAKPKYGVMEGVLFYDSKDSMSYRNLEKRYKLTDEWIERIERDIEKMNKYWDNKELPPPIPSYDWECKTTKGKNKSPYCKFINCPNNEY